MINLQTLGETILEDIQGAPGHFDLGWRYVVGADDHHPEPNATALIRFPVASAERPMGDIVHFNNPSSVVAANHVSHTNATSRPAHQQFACGSNATRGSHRDEIVCFPLDRYRNPGNVIDVFVVAPVMTDLNQPGGYGDDTQRSPKGNLDVTSEYFIWTTNMGGVGGRQDAFIVRVPKNVLVAEPEP